MRLRNSSVAATTISAAADGVGARRSATKSAIVTSTSWPMADTTGTGHATIARATRSSLNAQRSSIDPPPRPTMITSTPARGPALRIAVATSAAASSPCTRAGRISTLRVRRAAPQHLQDVAQRRAVERRDDPDAPRQRRQRTLPRRIEEPFGLQALLQLLERELQGAQAVRLHVLADDLVLALRLVHAQPAARDDVQAVLGLEPQVAHRRAEHDGLDLCAPPSLSVKYMCPVFHTLQFEISPSSQTSPNVVSSSARMPAVSSLTV